MSTRLIFELLMSKLRLSVPVAQPLLVAFLLCACAAVEPEYDRPQTRVAPMAVGSTLGPSRDRNGSSRRVDGNVGEKSYATRVEA